MAEYVMEEMDPTPEEQMRRRVDDHALKLGLAAPSKQFVAEIQG